MNNDLIERLKEARYSREVVNTSKREKIYVLIHIDLLSDTIDALSPVLPEDVQTGLEKLKRLKTFGRGREPELAQELTDLIERLAREKHAIAIANDILQKDYSRHKQRIEELEKARDFHIDSVAKHVEKARAQIAEYEKALDPELIGHMKMCIRMKLRKDQKQPDIAKDRIERGEKALKSCKALERIRGMK